MKSQQLKTRLAMLDGAIDKLAVFEPATEQASLVLLLQEHLRLAVLQFKLEALERGVEL